MIYFYFFSLFHMALLAIFFVYMQTKRSNTSVAKSVVIEKLQQQLANTIKP